MASEAGRQPKAIPAVLTPRLAPGQAWQSALEAPIGDGSNVSAPPLQNVIGTPPYISIVGVADQHKLGSGSAEPAVHGGG